MSTVRIAIDEDEVFPVYGIRIIDPAQFPPGAGYEADQSLIDEYRDALLAWETVQDKLAALVYRKDTP